MTPALHQQIAERAYFMWLDEGMPHGFADAHWACAEHAIVVEQTAAAPAAKARKPRATPRAAKPVAKAGLARAVVAKVAVAKAAVAKARSVATPLHS